ncbi:MAG: peptidoglycan DD-metalloendopeptidase family protein [Nocardioidaceae bacterium]|nr:peptidoglycan DD-metalloendopeptidase family protein [Nocardioidaceae bacterium]
MGTISRVSTIGGAALLAAVVGAATAGQSLSVGEAAAPTSPGDDGAYVANVLSAALEGREAPPVSRSGLRPRVDQAGTEPRNSARRGQELRKAELRQRELRKAELRQRELHKAKLREAAKIQAAKRAEKLRVARADMWVLPTSKYHVSGVFGEAGPYWSSGYHTGIDLAAGYGTPAFAVTNGVVARSGWDGAYGYQVRLRLGNGDEVWYSHLSSIDVTSGESVAKGQRLGRIGDTGNAFGYHLHLEYRLATDLDTGVDPEPHFVEHDAPL